MPNRSDARLKTLVAMPLVALLACGPQDHPPPLDGAGVSVDTSRRPHVTSADDDAQQERDVTGEGTLVVATRSSSVPSFLGSVHVVARDAAGRVVAGADEDESVQEPGLARGQLSLALPAGRSYRIELGARTTDPVPAECHAVVEPIAVEPDAEGHLQVLSWQCGERLGYVPPSVDSQCYWLARWMSVAQSAQAAGEPVAVWLQPSDGLTAPRVRWSVAPASAGFFSDPTASSTTFICGDEGESATLSVSIEQGACVERLTQAIACAPSRQNRNGD